MYIFKVKKINGSNSVPQMWSMTIFTKRLGKHYWLIYLIYTKYSITVTIFTKWFSYHY